MAVRLYHEAHAMPGGKEGGLSFRFASAVGEFALGEPMPFTPAAVRAEFRRMKVKARRPTHPDARRLAEWRMKMNRQKSARPDDRGQAAPRV